MAIVSDIEEETVACPSVELEQQRNNDDRLRITFRQATRYSFILPPGLGLESI